MKTTEYFSFQKLAFPNGKVFLQEFLLPALIKNGKKQEEQQMMNS